MIMAIAMLLILLSAVSVHAADGASITKPEDQSYAETGTAVTVKAKAGYSIPSGNLLLKPNYVYFRVTADTEPEPFHEYDNVSYTSTFEGYSLTYSFTPEQEGRYLIEVCRDLTYVNGAHVPLDEDQFQAEDRRTITVQKDLAKADTVISGVTDKVYTGEEITQAPVVTVDGKTLNPETDYDLSYETNTNAGPAKVVVTGKGLYKNSVKADFNILPADLSKAMISGLIDKTYTGKAQTQTPVVTWNGHELADGTDYELSYNNNTNAGTATVTATGKDNFTGSIAGTFAIQKESIRNTGEPTIKNMTYTGSPIKQNLNLWLGRKLVEGEDYTATYKNNVEPGTATVTIKGINNFKDSMVRTFSITEPSSSGTMNVITSPTANAEFAVDSQITVKAVAGIFHNTIL